MTKLLNKHRFKTLGSKQQHKVLSQILSLAHQEGHCLYQYNSLASLIELPPISFEKHSMADRFHLHCSKASIHFDESSWQKKQTDSLSTQPFLPINIYLSKLRSAHNVGSIIRTTEAFRLGSIHGCKDTPLKNHQKVDKTSMGTSQLVKLDQKTPFNQLLRPFIALEKTPNAKNLFSFNFPSSFTLLLGNEQSGLDQKTLDQCDHIIEIPLVGMKNSLNVANAFAITAGIIRNQNDENKN